MPRNNLTHSRTRSAFTSNKVGDVARSSATPERRDESRRRATITGAPNQKLTWGVALGDDTSAPLRRVDTVSREASTINLALIAQLLTENTLDTETYGIVESRDGFFDAFFLQPPTVEYSDLIKTIEPTLPDVFRSKDFFSVRRILMRQWEGLNAVVAEVFTTRSGLLVLKSFLAFYIAYVLCLVPTVRNWLGRYNYMMVVSTIVNHPGRTVGSQIDGAVLTTLGTAAGLGWGAVGLILSTSTVDARNGFAGVLALFFALFMAFIAFMRSYFIRLYQLVLCGGMAIVYTCLAEVDGHQVEWKKIYDYAIPWMLGQAIALAVCVVVYPDAGARPLAEVFHRAFGVMLDGLVIPRQRSREMRLRLSHAFFDLSAAHRDMKLDITVARFCARDIKDLKTHMQGVIRGLLSMKIDNELFEDLLHSRPATRQSGLSAISEKSAGARPRNPRAQTWAPSLADNEAQAKGLRILQEPTQGLLAAMKFGLQTCDAALMDMSGYRSYLGPPKDVSANLAEAEAKVAAAVKEFDDAEGDLSDTQELKRYNPEVIRLLVLARSVRMTTDPIKRLMSKMREMQAQSNHIRIDPPAYAFWKSLNRSNAQVRHDRGTVTPSSYSQTFARISELVNKIKAREHHPIMDDLGGDSDFDDTAESVTKAVEPSQNPESLRHRTWRALRHLQGFEGKFALRVVVMTGLLSAPAYVKSSRGWWNEYDAWWAVCMGWVMSHTMVGGSITDLFVRSLIVVMSALWSGFAYSARNGNPFVMAAFALLYMFPMIYRFTRSGHPRSGLAGCLSFSVISLGLVTSGGASPPAVVRGLAFLVGVVAATIVNWVLWPFIARHKLRKSVSSMLFFLSVVYRDMIAKYVYYEHCRPPTSTDVQQSESLESHLREGFIRIRQLLFLTPHEIRLRAPFDAVPYLALIDACEAFFDDLITVRQAALFYSAEFARKGEAARMILGYRRDTVATVLTNLYVLSGALGAGSKVPRYLPSAAVSRKRLLDKVVEMEAEIPEAHDPEVRQREKWALVYRYSYNESLTRCVAHVEDMEKWTKVILGERGFGDTSVNREEDYE